MTRVRVNVLTEGQTEMRFVKEVLSIFFVDRICIDACCVLTSRDRRTNREYRGGMTTYKKAKNDILRWLKADKSAYVTTMFDFFRLPTDFPGYEKAMQLSNHSEGVAFLETELEEDILREFPDMFPRRFIPYIQLHEFEALLFTDIRALKKDYLDEDDVAALETLYEETKDIPPEDINDGPETAPAKRLSRAIAYRKGDIPVAWAGEVSVPMIQDRCPHFSSWIDKLSGLRALG